MIESFRKTLQGLKISYKSIESFKKFYFLELLCFSIIFGIDLPKMNYVSNYYRGLERSGYSHIDAFYTLLPYIFVVIIEALLIYLVNYLLVYLYSRALASIKENFLNMLMGNRPNSSKISMGEAVNSIKTDPETITMTIDNTADLPGKAIFFIGAFLMAFLINKLIASIILLPLFSVLFLSNYLSTQVRKYSAENRETSAKVSSHLGDIVNNISTIKANGIEKEVIDELIVYGEKRRKSMIKTQITRELSWKVADISMGIAIFIALMLSASKLKTGELSAGDLFIFTYFPQSSFFIHTLGRITALSNSSLVSYKRIEEIVGEDKATKIFEGRNYKEDVVEDKISIKDICGNKEKTLKVSNLNSTFDGNNGVKDVNFTLKDGEFLAITGRIGSGKSTLMKTLIDSKEKDSGSIEYCGRTIDEGLISPLGTYTPQIPNLFSDTIKNNIILNLEYDEERFNKAVSDAVLDEDLKTMKDGAETLIGSKGVKLSGGQKQRVAVARMLYQESDIYLLDDVSSALDVRTEEKLWENLKNNKKTRIAISNRHNALMNADRILVLKDGMFDSIGSAKELLESSEEFRKIWGNEKA